MDRASIGKIDRGLAAAGVDHDGRLRVGERALQLGDVVYRIKQVDIVAVPMFSHPASLRAGRL
jgi:hypothetical protein